MAILYFLILLAPNGAQPTQREYFLGRPVGAFRLESPTLADSWDFHKKTQGASATVIYFLGTECSVNNLYVPIMNDLVGCPAIHDT